MLLLHFTIHKRSYPTGINSSGSEYTPDALCPTVDLYLVEGQRLHHVVRHQMLRLVAPCLLRHYVITHPRGGGAHNGDLEHCAQHRISESEAAIGSRTSTAVWRVRSSHLLLARFRAPAAHPSSFHELFHLPQNERAQRLVPLRWAQRTLECSKMHEVSVEPAKPIAEYLAALATQRDHLGQGFIPIFQSLLLLQTRLLDMGGLLSVRQSLLGDYSRRVCLGLRSLELRSVALLDVVVDRLRGRLPP